MGGSRKRSRQLALLAPLLVVVARGDGSVELLGDHTSQEKNQPSYRNGTSCVEFPWKQTADAVNFGSTGTSTTAGIAGGAAASTCQPSAFDIQATPSLNGKAHNSIFSSASIIPNREADLDGDSKCPSNMASLRDEIELLKMQVESLTRRQIENQAQCDASSSTTDPSADVVSSSRTIGAKRTAALPPSTLADAAAAGAVLGFFSGGPLLAAIGAVSTTWAATQDNPVGDVARAFGDLVAVTNSQLRKADEKYHILDHIGVAVRNLRSKASKVLRSIKTFEREKKVIDKMKASVAETWMKAVAFEREHRVVEEISQRMAKLVRTLAQVISGNSTTPGSDANEDWFGEARLE